MKKLLLAVLFALPVAAAAMPRIVEGVDPSQELTAFALRENVSENDPRVVQVRDWLAHVAKTTGEQEQAVAAACVRTAKFLLDGARVRASPLEPLEALATIAKPGMLMSDGLMAYVDARKRAPGKTHAEAMAALRGAPK